MMSISIENCSRKKNNQMILPHYKKFLLEETLETIKTFQKLIKSTLKWEKESHAHLLKCSKRIVLIVSSRESFNIHVIKSRILQFFLGRLFIGPVPCPLPLLLPRGWISRLGSSGWSDRKGKRMYTGKKKADCRLHCCCSRPPVEDAIC